MIMDDSFVGSIITHQQNLKKGNTGGQKNHIGIETGYLKNILKNKDPHQRLQESLGSLKTRYTSGSRNITSPAGPLAKHEKLRNGGNPEKITLCMGLLERETPIGKGGAAQSAKRFMPPLRGQRLFLSSGKEIVIGASDAETPITDYTYTTLYPSQLKRREPILIIWFSSVKNAITLYTVRKIQRGSF